MIQAPIWSPICSMTGFATRRGQYGSWSWGWDLRAVNGKGLDLRLRLPDWIDGLETGLRGALSQGLARGNVNLTLRITRDGAAEAPWRVNPDALRAALAMLAAVEEQAMATGVTLAQATQADVLMMRGVTEQSGMTEDTGPLCAALMQDFAVLLADLQDMRASEGAALRGVVQDQLAQIADLVTAAEVQADARRDLAAQTLKDAIAKVLHAADGIDQTRLAQELALLAVKSDVTEELDRLRAHGTAATGLLAAGGPVGRKLDFLMQEFMREANTLCAKAQSLTLTRVGLDLKTVIDQMREQVQNVE
jgi:uncharacterized protein (TIGR00255 family)